MLHESRLRDEKVAFFNAEQRAAFNNIVAAVKQNDLNAHFFLQNSINTDKTYLYKRLCYYFRAQNRIVLYVIFINVTALLLFNEQISHSRFKILI